MAVELAVGYVSIVPSARGFGSKLSQEISPSLRSAGAQGAQALEGSLSVRMGGVGRRVAAAFGIAFGARAIASFGNFALESAKSMEQTRIAFRGIIGDVGVADKAIADLQRFAAVSPFKLDGLAESAKMLLAVGFAADELIPTMTILGNLGAALGVGEDEIRGVVRALGQMKGKGKAAAEELRQISEAVPGFSAIDALAKDLGITTQEAFKQMEVGAIPADRAIKAILNGMAKFPGAAGAMERQAKTLKGVLSTLHDTLEIALVQGIEPFLPGIAAALLTTAPLIEKTVGSTTRVLAQLAHDFNVLGDRIRVALSTDAFGPLAEAASVIGSATSAALGEAVKAWRDYIDNGIGPIADVFDRIHIGMAETNRLLGEQRNVLIPLGAAVAALSVQFGATLLAARALLAVQKILSAISTAMFILNAVFLANPIVATITVVVALGAAFFAAYKNIKPFHDAVDSTARLIREVAIAAFGQLLVLGEKVGPALAAAGQAIRDGLGRALASVGGVIQRNVVDPLRPLGRFIQTEIAPTLSAVGEFLSALFARVADVIGPFVTILAAQFGFLAGLVAGVFAPAVRVAAQVAGDTFQQLSVIFLSVARVAIPVLSLAFEVFTRIVDVAFGVITATIRTFLDTVRGVFLIIGGILQGDFGKVWQGLVLIVGAPVRATRDIVVNTFEEVVGFVGGLPSRLADIGSAIWQGFLDVSGTILRNTRDLALTIFDEIVLFVTNLPGRILTAASGMWDGITDAFRSAINFIIRGWNSLQFKLPSYGGLEIAGHTVIPGFEGPVLGVPPMNLLAAGGVSTGPTLGIFGEAGAEAILPLSPESLRPFALALVDAMNVSEGGGGGRVYHTTINNPVSEPASDSLRALRRIGFETAAA